MIIFPASLIGTADPSLDFCRIGWHNLLRYLLPADITASSETAGGPADAPLRPDTAEAWLPSALPATWQADLGAPMDVDYIGIAGHTIGSSGATVMVETDALPTPSFSLRFGDLGAGEVDLVPLRGTGAATFTRATTATTVDENGLIISVASGVPRSYYDPATLEYRGYLAEGARTNGMWPSENFTHGNYASGVGVARSSAAVTNPMGGAAAGLITSTAGAGAHYIAGTALGTLTSGVTYSQLFIIKKGNQRYATVGEAGGALWRVATFDFDTETITNQTNCTAQVKKFPGGWYAFSITFTRGDTSTGLILCSFGPVSNGASAQNYTAAGTETGYLFAMQNEVGSFASSYIPTTTAAVTRNADLLTYPFSGNADATQGTAYAEVKANWTTHAVGYPVVAFVESSANILYHADGQAITGFAADDQTNAAVKTGLSDLSTGVRKRVVSWGALGLRVTGDGAVPATSAFDGNTGSTAIAIGSTPAGTVSQWFGTIKNVQLWSTQLTNAQLQTITAASLYPFDPPWQLFSLGATPPDDSPMLFLDAPRTVRYVRLSFTGAGAAPKIAVIYAGEILAMPRDMTPGGFTPVNLSRQTELHQSLSRGGQFLGQGFRRMGVKGSIAFKYLDPDWMRSEFEPFVLAARNQPYFIGWWPRQYPLECGYVWTDKDIVPSYMGFNDAANQSLMDVGWSMQGIGWQE